MPDVWTPSVYDQFARERRQPFDDLVALVRPRPAMRVVDLGCGTGKLTRELHERLGATSTLGLDSSPRMLAAAVAGGGVTFRHEDLASFAAHALERYDLVFSNAALHWLPEHERLFTDLARLVAPGGQLAVQLPANHGEPPHVVAMEVAREEPFVSALAGAADERSVLPLERYATLLYGLGLKPPRVRLELYVHELAGPEAVLEWVRGTTLTWYEARLDAETFARFLARYRERLASRLCDARPYPFTFRRILLWAEKGA